MEHNIMNTPTTINQSATACSMCNSNIDDNRSEKIDRKGDGDDAELGSVSFGSQSKVFSNFNSFHVVPHSFPSVDQANYVSNEDKEYVVCKSSDVPMCHIQLDQLEKLQNNTKKLLCLLEEVQEKTHSTALVPDDPPKLSHALKPFTIWDNDSCDNIVNRSVADIIGSAALKRLEKHARELDAIIIKDEDDDCSVYKRLTRKCHCLNQREYNDFIIHFNEETMYCTNSIGEIIKNMRIIKKFLYMGGIYTKNALLFLNQGLEEGSQSEKAEIAQACAFADLCCIFEPHTIVTVCISWPCKTSGLIEPKTQELTAEFLHNLAKLEEGRRYLNLNSKITSAIKKILKKKQDKLTFDTVEMLNSVLDLCQIPLPRVSSQSITYQCRPTEEDMGNKILNALMAYRRFMSQNELFMHLNILKSLSGNEVKKKELTPHLPGMIALFKNMLLEFNNRAMNLVITTIMNNMVACNGQNQNQKRIEGDGLTMATICTATATENIKQKHVNTQMPYIPKKNQKKHHVHRPQHESRPAIVIKKKDPANKQVAAPLPKYNAKQNTNTISNANRQASTQGGFRSKSAPFSNSRFKKWDPQQLQETITRRPQSVAPASTTFISRSQKFTGGDKLQLDKGVLIDSKNVIVVPMDEKTTDDTE